MSTEVYGPARSSPRRDRYRAAEPGEGTKGDKLATCHRDSGTNFLYRVE